MTTRLLVCLGVSLCIHALVLVQPWALMAVSGAPARNSDTVPVRILDQQQLSEQLQAEKEREQHEQTEGLSFEAEGYVSAGYMDLLKARIFNAWEYPRDAIEKGQEGVVKIRFVLDGSGSVGEVSVVRSSGSGSLDAAAGEAVRKASPFGRFPEGMTDGTLGITGTFCYVLD